MCPYSPHEDSGGPWGPRTLSPGGLWTGFGDWGTWRGARQLCFPWRLTSAEGATPRAVVTLRRGRKGQLTVSG